MIKHILAAIFVFTVSLFLSAQSIEWRETPNQKRESQQIYPESYRTMVVDFESLKSKLLAAPAEGKM